MISGCPEQNKTPGAARYDKEESLNDTNSQSSSDQIDTQEQLNLTPQNKQKIIEILEGHVSIRYLKPLIGFEKLTVVCREFQLKTQF